MSDKTTDFGYKKVNVEEKAGKVAELPGFGEKTATNILKAIEHMRSHAGEFRYGDIAALAIHFWREMGGDPYAIPRELLQKWEDYPWPGNIRELRNVLERARLFAEDGQITTCLRGGGRLRSDAVLYALGRDGNTKNLGLEELGIPVDKPVGVGRVGRAPDAPREAALPALFAR